ncbi:MAG: PHP domain-containing protein [Candidatus Nealsonbacteria bacterium]|nr:PHP domain-containing protein [Candidatus Nealsonbacteria bacterium]
MKADLHVHTNFSYDGVSSPQEVVRAALEKGIECLCITDHNEIRGAVQAMKFSYDKNILIVPGIEILSSSGDILGINVKKVIPDRLSAKETIKEIRRQGGIAVIPHPFGKPFTNFWGGEKVLKKLDIDAIEAFNATVFFSKSNIRSFNFAQKFNLPFTAGSDAHKAKHIGSAYLEFSKKVQSVEELVEEILKKEAVISGKVLGIRETFKDRTNADVAKMLRYTFLKLKNHRKNKMVS